VAGVVLCIGLERRASCETVRLCSVEPDLITLCWNRSDQPLRSVTHLVLAAVAEAPPPIPLVRDQ
jgi:hypothetical protein